MEPEVKTVVIYVWVAYTSTIQINCQLRAGGINNVVKAPYSL